jgi:hypothetical protein
MLAELEGITMDFKKFVADLAARFRKLNEPTPSSSLAPPVPGADIDGAYAASVAHELGRRAGHEVGRAEGYELGRDVGYEAGRAEGYEVGRQAGYESSHAEGYEAGYKKGLRRRLPNRFRGQDAAGATTAIGTAAPGTAIELG